MSRKKWHIEHFDIVFSQLEGKILLCFVIDAILYQNSFEIERCCAQRGFVPATRLLFREGLEYHHSIILAIAWLASLQPGESGKILDYTRRLPCRS